MNFVAHDQYLKRDRRENISTLLVLRLKNWFLKLLLQIRMLLCVVI